MAISDTQKVDYLFKKLGYGVSKTDTTANKEAYNESIASPLLIRGDTVWTDAGNIPSVKPTSSNSDVTVYDDSGSTSSTVECSEDITATDNRTWKTNLVDWIPTEFGSTYQIKVYIDSTSESAPQTTGTQIFAAGSGNNDEWFFDYQSGVLHFIGTSLPTAITSGVTGKSIYVVGARYTGDKGVTGASDLVFTNTTITTSTSNANIVLDPNGTGNVTIDTNTGLVIPLGTTGQRPGTPSTATMRFNSSISKIEVYNGSTWETVGINLASISTQSIIGDGTTTVFTLSQSTTAGSIIVSINGVLQVPDSGYTVSGTSLTVAEAMATSDIMEVRFISNLTTVTEVTNASGTTSFSINGTTASVVIDSTTIAEIASDEVVNISNAHSLKLPMYTTVEANALSNKAVGQIVYISDADGGNPSLSFYDGSVWKYIASGENVEDVVGAMFSGNTESGITATYQDSDGTIDFDVNDPTITLTGAVNGSAVMTNLGNVSITTTATNDPIITLAGAVTGSATMTDLGNVTITTTATSDPTLTLSGDVSGSATFTNLGNATLSVTISDDSHNHVISNIDGLQTALDAKTTPSYVNTQITNLIGGAPGTLDTLNELAAAINDDASYASTLTTALGTKVAKSGDTLTGKLTLDGDPTASLHAATKSYVDTATSAGNINLGTDTTGNYVATGATSGSGISGSVASEGGTFTVTSNATTSNTANTIVFRDVSGNFTAGTMSGTATTAQYADLAENYTSDKQYSHGTVLMLGGNAEVTECNEYCSKHIVGVVSTNPAYLMNSEVNEMHVAVALQGRVPCKVVGVVERGDLIVASNINGCAEAWTNTVADPRAGTIIGKSLENKTSLECELIEVIVGLK